MENFLDFNSENSENSQLGMNIYQDEENPYEFSGRVQYQKPIYDSNNYDLSTGEDVDKKASEINQMMREDSNYEKKNEGDDEISKPEKEEDKKYVYGHVVKAFFKFIDTEHDHFSKLKKKRYWDLKTINQFFSNPEHLIHNHRIRDFISKMKGSDFNGMKIQYETLEYILSNKAKILEKILKGSAFIMLDHHNNDSLSKNKSNNYLAYDSQKMNGSNLFNHDNDSIDYFTGSYPRKKYNDKKF